MTERSWKDYDKDVVPADANISAEAETETRTEKTDTETETDLLAEAPPEASAEPPVVARLVVEVRSDGRVTVARGAMEDAVSGGKVAIEARGDSPLSLALSLAKQMFRVPRLARRASRSLLPGRRRR